MAASEDTVTRTTVTSTTAAVGSDRDLDSRQIRSNIDRTRASMDETFDALEQKLTPTQLAFEAWSLFKGGSSAGASRIWQIAKEHPAPAAVIGVGLGWLLVESSRSNDSDYGDYRAPRGYSSRRGYGSAYAGTAGYRAYDRAYDYDTGDFNYESDEEGRLASAAHNVRDKVSNVAGSARDSVGNAASSVRETVSGATERVAETASHLRERTRERAHDLKDQTRYRTQQARVGFWQMMEERPLALGVATLAIGVLAGLSIPSTRKENELMGETRDRLLERAKEVGEEALEKGKQVASVAVDTLKDEAQKQDLTPQAIAEKVRTVAREAKNTVQEEGKRQASDLKDTVKSDLHGGASGSSFGGGSNLGSTPGSTSGTGSTLGSERSTDVAGRAGSTTPTVGTTPTTGGSVTSSATSGTGNNRQDKPVEEHEPEFSRR